METYCEPAGIIYMCIYSELIETVWKQFEKHQKHVRNERGIEGQMNKVID